MRKTWICLLLAVAFLTCGPPGKSVRIELPLPPKLDLTNFGRIYFPGFVIDVENKDFDTEAEAIKFFKQEFGRKKVMEVVEAPPVEMEASDPREFFGREQPFFKNLQVDEKANTLAVTGVITFEVLDRSGFREVKTTDRIGRTFYRTQFVAMTGFKINMRVFVYEMGEGRLLYRELLRDNLDIEGEGVDERLVFNELMNRISERVIGLFSDTVVKAERTLL